MIQLGPLHASLSAVEIAFDEFVAQRRMKDVRAHHRENRAALATGDDEMSNHVVGAHGEHAFAKWLGVERTASRKFGVCSECHCYVGTVNTFKSEGDVGSYQVRTRRYGAARLIVRTDDKDSDVFVLVLPGVTDVEKVINPSVHRTWRMVGWIRGGDAKQYEWRDDPRGRGAAYFVPHNALNPMITLPFDEEMKDATRINRQLQGKAGTTVPREAQGVGAGDRAKR